MGGHTVGGRNGSSGNRRAGWYREVRVKSRRAMLAKALLGARSQLLNMSLALENQIRGILKTFGRIVPKGPADCSIRTFAR